MKPNTQLQVNNNYTKKHKHSNNNRDRLSELPDELLVQILSILPIRDAVRTVLLRRFGNLWTLVPTLEFVYPHDDKFVRNVIKYHKSPTIEKMEVSEVVALSQLTLNKCAKLASTKKTKELIVYVNYEGKEGESENYRLPHYVFRSEHIVLLVLDNMTISLKRSISMGSLRKLELVDVRFSEDTFYRMVVGCPCLKELVIIHPYGIKGLHFTAPNIEKLMLRLHITTVGMGDEAFTLDCPNLRILHVEETYMDYIQLINVSSVYHAFLNPYQRSDNLEKLVDKFPDVEILHEGYAAYAQLRQCGDGLQLDSQNNRWTRLLLKSRNHGSCLRNIVCRLLKVSQCLKELTIYADGDYFCDCEMLLYELSSHCVMHLLRTITIRRCDKPYKGLLQLIKFVLNSAIVLDKIVISCSKKDQVFSTDGQELITKLLSFPRASPNAVAIQIMFSA